MQLQTKQTQFDLCECEWGGVNGYYSYSWGDCAFPSSCSEFAKEEICKHYVKSSEMHICQKHNS